MYYSTELYFEPQDIISQISLEGNSNMTSEMTSFDLAFLCGLIKEYRPYKILEVGVSGGGTSAVIMNCLSKLELSAELYSVDLLDTYYRDPRKKMGYLADNVKLGGGRGY